MASQTLKEHVAVRFLENDSRLFNPSQPLIAHCRGVTPLAPLFRKRQPSRANGAPTE
jgi:hypothetical protein